MCRSYKLLLAMLMLNVFFVALPSIAMARAYQHPGVNWDDINLSDNDNDDDDDTIDEEDEDGEEDTEEQRRLEGVFNAIRFFVEDVHTLVMKKGTREERVFCNRSVHNIVTSGDDKWVFVHLLPDRRFVFGPDFGVPESAYGQDVLCFKYNEQDERYDIVLTLHGKGSCIDSIVCDEESEDMVHVALEGDESGIINLVGGCQEDGKSVEVNVLG